MLECRKYKEQRMALRKSVGIGRMKMDKLLGDVKIIKHIAVFSISVNRLKIPLTIFAP